MSIFTDIFIKKPGTSKQVLDHPVFTSTDFGKIIPILYEDLVPGDIFKVKSALEIKLKPTLAPVRQGIEVRVDYFFVPNRLVWDNWQSFITGGVDGTEEPVRPFVRPRSSNYPPGVPCGIGSLWDYFGLPAQLPVGVRGNENLLEPVYPVDAMPFRAYYLIYNEYYRDQNLQNEVEFNKTDGFDDTLYVLKYRGLKKDYFTASLPFTQRGPEVTLDFLNKDKAPIVSDGLLVDTMVEDGYEPMSSSQLSGTAQFRESGDTFSIGDSNTVAVHKHMINADDIAEALQADLSNVGAGITINEFRRLNAVQKWLERNARAGSRYVEQILSHFGVRTPDYRLDRPEYIGGFHQNIGMAEVLQTSETAMSPQGTRAGVGFGNMLSKSRRFRADEHGMVIGLMSILPSNNIYGDGYDKKWLRTSRFDYYFPEFQYLGEQSVKSMEIFGYGNNASELESDFGYTPRFAEYRYHPGKVTGNMRASQSYWHMARLFNTRPVLNSNFIDSQASLQDYDRMFPTDVALGDRFDVFIQHFERLRRPMAKNPNPSL